MSRKQKRKKEPDPVKLELGYTDISKLRKYPWLWADGSVAECTITDVFHYIPARERASFMDELYRVLVVGGKATMITAYYSTAMAIADFNLEWPPICEQSYLYFNREWRENNKLPYKINADYDFTYGYLLVPDVAGRSNEVQTFQVRSYLNTVQRLQVALVKRAPVRPN